MRLKAAEVIIHKTVAKPTQQFQIEDERVKSITIHIVSESEVERAAQAIEAGLGHLV